jgi:hypothetical protein
MGPVLKNSEQIIAISIVTSNAKFHDRQQNVQGQPNRKPNAFGYGSSGNFKRG